MSAFARTPEPADALVFRGVSVDYGAEAVLTGVDLALRPGEVLGCIGPNGAGKTTLLRAVTGAAVVRDGEVTLLGAALGAYSARDLARVVAVLPQGVEASFAFSGRRFVEMGREPWRGPFDALSAEDVAAVDRALELTDTARLADAAIDTLSGGDLQRLALAQALAQEPRVLLLDEPTSHLDIDHRLQVLDLVRSLAGTAIAVLGVFHDLDMAARYADRLAVVADGRVREPGAPRDVLTPQLLDEVFRVRAVTGTDAVTGAVTVSPIARGASLPEPSGPRVLVVSGSGTGAGILRDLVLGGFDVTAAALTHGDTDLAVARALHVPAVDLAPFAAVDEEAAQAVALLATRADAIVVAPTPFGRANLGNLRAIVSEASRTVFAGTMEPERDFTDGEATALVEEMLTRGARVTPAEGVVAAVESLGARVRAEHGGGEQT